MSTPLGVKDTCQTRKLNQHVHDETLICVPLLRAVIAAIPGSRFPGWRCRCPRVQSLCSVCSCSPASQFPSCSESSNDSFSSASVPKPHQSWDNKWVQKDVTDFHVNPGCCTNTQSPARLWEACVGAKFLLFVCKYLGLNFSLGCYFLKSEYILEYGRGVCAPQWKWRRVRNRE